MKRVGGLFDQFHDVKTLTYAIWRAAQGKHDRAEVRSFLGTPSSSLAPPTREPSQSSAFPGEGAEGQLAEISHRLRCSTYRFGAYRSFAIRDPKSRTIHAPPFCDRVVHHAIIAVAGPVFERGAIAHSYACRKGRGQHAALAQARRWMQPGEWFLKMDVAKFYDSIDHAVLRRMLARRFRERRLLDLFDALLFSYKTAPGRGLPIGALTSQYLGNFYLDGIDHCIAETAGHRRYLRYMDDMVVFGQRDELRKLRDQVDSMLDELGLRLKDGGVLNRCDLGVPLLGFTLYPNRMRLNPGGRKRLRRRLRELETAWSRERIDDGALQTRGDALLAHARAADDAGWRRVVVGFSRVELGEAQRPATRDARRLVGQHAYEVPVGLSQQESSRQPQPQYRFPGLSGPRHGDEMCRRTTRLPVPDESRDKTTTQLPLADIQPERGEEKAGGGDLREGKS